jgi:hypothetical protein
LTGKVEATTMPFPKGFIASTLATMMVVGAAVGQQNTLKEQIVGTWMVLSLINETNGKKIEPFGPNPKGYFMFDSKGHFSTHIIRAYRPKFANRDNPTPMESKAVVEGTISAFGTYMKQIIRYSCKSSAAAFRPGTTPIRNASSLSAETR